MKSGSIESNDPEADFSSYDSRFTNEQPSYAIEKYETQTIDYNAMIPEKYTLSFEYLWALLVMSENYDFVKGLADLSYNSRITISILDCLDEDTTVTNYTYTKITRDYSQPTYTYYDENNTYLDSQVGSEKIDSSIMEDYYVTMRIHTFSNTVDVQLTYADVWIVTYTTKYDFYENGVKEGNGQGKVTTSVIGEETESDKLNERYQEGSGYDLSDDGSKMKTNTRYWQKIFKSKTNVETIEYAYNSKYVNNASETKTIEKTNKEGELDEDGNKISENFCSLFCICPTQSYILDNMGWLVEILESNEETTDMVDLTKYLIYKATGKEEYKVEGFNFDDLFIVPLSYSSLSGGGSSLVTYLRQFSHAGEAPKSDDGKYYLMYGDSKGWPTIGNSDLQWKSHYKNFNVPGMVLKDGKETQVPSISDYVNSFLTKGAEAQYTNQEIENMKIYVEIEKVDEIGGEAANNTYKSIEKETAGLNLSKQQIYALTAIQYNFGHLPERNGYTFKEVYEAGLATYEKDSWQHNKFIWDNWWAYLGGGSPGHIPSRDAAYETYIKGVYDFSESPAGKVFSRGYYIYYTQEQLNWYSYAPSKKITRTSSNEKDIFIYEENSVSDMVQLMLQKADEVAKYLEQNNYTYLAADKGNYTFPITGNTKRTISCSSYVSEVLYRMGYEAQLVGSQKIYAYTNAIEQKSNIERNLGVKAVIVDVDNLQPGDFAVCGTKGKNHIVIVYSVKGENVQVKGVPEVLNSGGGFAGKNRTRSYLKSNNYFGIRITDW